jgi:precorrin-2 methylase
MRDKQNKKRWEAQHETRLRQEVEQKIMADKKEIKNQFPRKNEYGNHDLTPFNAHKTIKGGKVEDITLGDNHIYGSIFELGSRMPGSFGVKG